MEAIRFNSKERVRYKDIGLIILHYIEKCVRRANTGIRSWECVLVAVDKILQ